MNRETIQMSMNTYACVSCGRDILHVGKLCDYAEMTGRMGYFTLKRDSGHVCDLPESQADRCVITVVGDVSTEQHLPDCEHFGESGT